MNSTMTITVFVLFLIGASLSAFKVAAATADLILDMVWPRKRVMEPRYFLTVDWCQKGNRGIFCDQDGRAFSKGGEPHTLNEMREILGPFWLVLSPNSKRFSEEETAKYQNWFPLGEYQGKYGYAVSLEV